MSLWHELTHRVLEYSQKKVTSLSKALLNLCYFHTHFYQFLKMASTDIVSVSLERLRILENIIRISATRTVVYVVRYSYVHSWDFLLKNMQLRHLSDYLTGCRNHTHMFATLFNQEQNLKVYLHYSTSRSPHTIRNKTDLIRIKVNKFRERRALYICKYNNFFLMFIGHKVDGQKCKFSVINRLQILQNHSLWNPLRKTSTYMNRDECAARHCS